MQDLPGSAMPKNPEEISWINLHPARPSIGLLLLAAADHRRSGAWSSSKPSTSLVITELEGAICSPFDGQEWQCQVMPEAAVVVEPSTKTARIEVCRDSPRTHARLELIELRPKI